MLTKLNARSLILDLLFANPSMVMTTRQIVLAAQLFEIRDNNIRVALTRLSTDGLIESAGRGAYCLSELAQQISKPAMSQSKALKATREWSGQYLAVHTGALGRVDRTALKRRERTLRLNGFRELQADLFIRPDNLAESFDNTRERLLSTGLEAQVVMFVAHDFDEKSQHKIKELWDCHALNTRYQNNSTHIQHWLSTVDELELDTAVRESLLIGRQVIPLLISDPVLPESFIDCAARAQFAANVSRLDQIGHELWQQFYRQSLSSTAQE
jgi:phenylacetic acid degradation operon negative regulatory protein